MTNHRVGGTQIETGVDGGAETQLRSGSNEMAARLVQLVLSSGAN